MDYGHFDQSVSHISLEGYVDTQTTDTFAELYCTSHLSLTSIYQKCSLCIVSLYIFSETMSHAAAPTISNDVKCHAIAMKMEIIVASDNGSETETDSASPISEEDIALVAIM
jgi:hypothetical protein